MPATVSTTMVATTPINAPVRYDVAEPTSAPRPQQISTMMATSKIMSAPYAS
jgi:hypothetical protein